MFTTERSDGVFICGLFYGFIILCCEVFHFLRKWFGMWVKELQFERGGVCGDLVPYGQPKNLKGEGKK